MSRWSGRTSRLITNASWMASTGTSTWRPFRLEFKLKKQCSRDLWRSGRRIKLSKASLISLLYLPIEARGMKRSRRSARMARAVVATTQVMRMTGLIQTTSRSRGRLSLSSRPNKKRSRQMLRKRKRRAKRRRRKRVPTFRGRTLNQTWLASTR